jgi:hypothetical protein
MHLSRFITIATCARTLTSLAAFRSRAAERRSAKG